MREKFIKKKLTASKAMVEMNLKIITKMSKTNKIKQMKTNKIKKNNYGTVVDAHARMSYEAASLDAHIYCKQHYVYAVQFIL